MANSNKSNRTRKDIREALIKLLIKKDFDDISIIEICETALITRATFYKYYEDKYHLVSCLIDDYKDLLFKSTLENKTFSTPKELFSFIATTLLDIMQEYYQVLSKIYIHCKKQKLNEQIMDILDCYVLDILKEQSKMVNFTVPIKILSKFFSAGFLHLALAMLEHPKIFNRNDIMNFVELELSNDKIMLPR